MESVERKVILILADISGYTEFMVSNKETLAHAQVIVSELIKAIIRQVEIPLEISKLEGDAVFLYAIKGEDTSTWDEVRREIGAKLLGFFDAFSDKLAELHASNTCNCDACQHVDSLKLKAIVHSGQALFYSIGRFQELSGVDVILAHRLLKNSVESDQYVLLTEAAYQDVEFPEQIDVAEGQETYENIGSVKTYVYYPPGDEMFYLEIQEAQGYDSAWYRFKNAAVKMLSVLLVQLGLKKVPEYKHLPAL
jgi:class 3 adenylate cyclase